jgi:Ca2+-binding EF-hand superfamily protein
MTLATATVAMVGGVFLAGSSFADRLGSAHGMMGGFGELRRELLKTVDTNDDGSISQDEINAAVDSRLTQFDADKDGSLSLSEFEALWADLTRPAAVRAFQFLDPDGSASVSKQELDERFGKIVDRFDRNGDGVLSKDDRPRHHRAMHRRWSNDDGPRHGRDRGPHPRWWQNDSGPDRNDAGPDGDTAE